LLILRKGIAADESYFGAKRIKGKRDCGAGSKTPVFGILQRNGKIYTEIVPSLCQGYVTGHYTW
tara:strand:- start:240 stop:431 length:192 start_codon:yes stop_codon:yes gene_type:complete